MRKKFQFKNHLKFCFPMDGGNTKSLSFYLPFLTLKNITSEIAWNYMVLWLSSSLLPSPTTSIVFEQLVD